MLHDIENMESLPELNIVKPQTIKVRLKFLGEAQMQPWNHEQSSVEQDERKQTRKIENV